MRRVLSLVVLVLFSLGGLVGMQVVAVRKLGQRLAEDRAEAAAFEVKHAGGQPVHDNGLQCVKLLLDVTPPDAAKRFSTAPKELNDEVRAQVEATSPWVRGLRECASSARLRYVAGLSPETPRARARELMAATLPRLFHFTAVEARLILEEKQPALALERCTDALALGADLSHLGAEGVEVLRGGLEALAPACAQALANASPEERAAVAKRWADVAARMASGAQVVRHERLAGVLRRYDWVLEQPGATPPPSAGFVERLREGRAAVAFDEAMRALEAVADQPGPVRDAAAARAGELGRTLTRRDEANELLTLLLALALDDKSERPHVTRTQDAVTYTPANLTLPLSPWAKPSGATTLGEEQGRGEGKPN